MATQLQRYFMGYSTQNSSRTGVSSLYDIELINVDLMTSFQTRIGERVMRPDWGCKLWDYLMEPLTPTMRDQIINETLRICNLDTRTVMQSANVTSLEHGFRIDVVLEYQPWKVIGTFTASFEQDERLYFGA